MASRKKPVSQLTLAELKALVLDFTAPSDLRCEALLVLERQGGVESR